MTPTSKRTTLKRSLGLTQLVLYGLGTTIGAGIYALVGELAGISGMMAPASFLLASLMAGMTAMSFAELSARYPKAAGASLYIQQGFGSIRLAAAAGVLVIFAGVVSSAALVNAFISHLNQFIDIDKTTGVVGSVLIIGALAAWGIVQSVFIAALITLIEIGGLLLVIFYSLPVYSVLPERLPELLPGPGSGDWHAIYAGALLAFYAFIGFEDMVDVAEEVENVKRNLPRAIIITLVSTTIMYMLIMLAAVFAIPPEQLAKEKAPLAALFQHLSGGNAVVISLIGMLAIVNGVLVQLIMASRVLYGLSSRGQLPPVFSRVNSLTRTPLVATITAVSLVLFFALTGELATLAESTSLIILVIFALVNLSLWFVKKQYPAPEGILTIPAWLPMGGFIVSSGFVVSRLV